MACRFWISLVLVAKAFGLGTGWGAFGQTAQGGFQHPGRVVDMLAHKGLSASVKAWPQSNISSYIGNCPLFGKQPFDSTTSKPGNGLFSLTVDKSYRTYTVTYCLPGYQPRGDRDQQNRMNGSPVRPTPTELYPSTETNDTAFFRDVTERKAIGLMNDLSYLYSVNPTLFIATMAEVAKSSEENTNAIRTLSVLTQHWGGGASVPPK